VEAALQPRTNWLVAMEGEMNYCLVILLEMATKTRKGAITPLELGALRVGGTRLLSPPFWIQVLTPISVCTGS